MAPLKLAGTFSVGNGSDWMVTGSVARVICCCWPPTRPPKKFCSAPVTITTEAVNNEGVPVLLIQGRIVSTAKRTVEVPRLRFAIRNASGIEIYSWTALPTRSLLSPGEAVAFQSRLASPPPETHDVLVRFFNRHDLGVGIQ